MIVIANCQFEIYAVFSAYIFCEDGKDKKYVNGKEALLE